MGGVNFDPIEGDEAGLVPAFPRELSEKPAELEVGAEDKLSSEPGRPSFIS